MQLSVTIATIAVVLGIAAAGGYAVGEDAAPEPQPMVETNAEELERACNEPLTSDIDLQLCRRPERALTPEMEGPARGGAWVPEHSGGA